MNEVEKQLLQDYEQEHGPEGITFRVRELISTLAELITVERSLQAVISAEGTTYTTKGDKGQQVHKHRPEAVELLKVRQMKLQYLKQLGLGVSKEQVESW